MGALNLDRDSSALLSIPAELRNQIYSQLFPLPQYIPAKVDEAVCLPTLADFGKPAPYLLAVKPPVHPEITGACRQLCDETRLMFFENTIFYLNGAIAEPCAFAIRTAHMRPKTKRAIRHVVLTARISHLRALNESWDSVPFGDDNVFLDTLTLVPHRADTSFVQPYAEVADLSQCHTLAYILTETLKSLRNVQTVVVRNEGCFNPVIWRLSYRSLVYRLWKWGGRLCDLRFCEDEKEQMFSVRCGPGHLDKTRYNDSNETRWRDVSHEMNRLLGGEGSRDGMPEANL